MTKRLPEYSSFKEKEQHFKISYIDTIDQFKDFYTTHLESKGIYRGINNSSYKIFNSLQRQIIEKDLNLNIKDYISATRNEEILNKYFNTFKIIPSKLSIWSYLQHYGAPTPLIDFTYNIRKAIYFAIEKFDQSNFISTNSLADRFSIFFIDNNDLELIKIHDIFKSFAKYKIAATKGFNSYPPDSNFDYNALLSHFDEMFDLDVLEIFLMDFQDEFVEVFNSYNNIRILAQEGLFINNSNKDLPLEEALKTFFIEATQYQTSIWDDIDTPEADKINKEYINALDKNVDYQKRLETNIIHSFEIKKELIPEIREILSLSKKDIYPNEENLVWEIFTNSIKNA